MRNLFIPVLDREFLTLIETTEMQKVYKMPILYSFYNDGNIRLDVKEEEVLETGKSSLMREQTGRILLRICLMKNIKRYRIKNICKKRKRCRFKYLKKSGNGFFTEKEGYAIAISDKMKDVIENETFKIHMKDILEYRTMEYYRRRYRAKDNL